MALQALLQTPATALIALSFAFPITLLVYRLFFHPLARVPGPFYASLSSLWIYTQSYRGTEASAIDALHARYGPVVRVAPNEVDISDGAALAPIYTERGGFIKAQCYSNFDIDGHPTIFSELNVAERAKRAKAVAGMFSTASLRAGNDAIKECVDRMLSRMEREATSGQVVNLLNLTRSLALDAVSAYLFGKGYNGIQEEKLSASEFVDTFVAVGRFFYLPSAVFAFVEHWSAQLDENKQHVEKSMQTVDDFVSELVEDASEDGTAYQSRLLKAGILKHETKAQCKDLMFAGTDSTGMNLAMICWFLAQYPDRYSRLRREVLEAPPSSDPQSLPYLACVIKEGLRLSMANPTRLPRVVPPSGFPFSASNGKSYNFPPGALVGCAPYSLHFNTEIFESPRSFIPERWETPTKEMVRDHIPFGLGTRQCIARNLATVELFIAVAEIARRDVLSGARIVRDKIEIVEWFNSKVKGERIELVWK
ncbi:cytochrome P450 [Aulographum hederae CBS 113979]|uniref:Cytochrome P450 n=1 Tax=Aulographum hederae CBS 113979 TaxID=1176131 RepID=A0A6G1GP05_9PEZI|nr:cytochrome P450 [Aulographum hederae CBS 113979]